MSSKCCKSRTVSQDTNGGRDKAIQVLLSAPLWSNLASMSKDVQPPPQASKWVSRDTKDVQPQQKWASVPLKWASVSAGIPKRTVVTWPNITGFNLYKVHFIHVLELNRRSLIQHGIISCCDLSHWESDDKLHINVQLMYKSDTEVLILLLDASNA